MYAFVFEDPELYICTENVLSHKMAAASIKHFYSQSLQLLQVLEGSSLDRGDFVLHQLPEGETPEESETIKSKREEGDKDSDRETHGA